MISLDDYIVRGAVILINLLFFGMGFLWGRSLTPDLEYQIKQTRANSKLLLTKLRLEEPLILKSEKRND